MKEEIKVNGSTIFTLMGRQTRANYKEQEVNQYIGNPLIEALPKIYSREEVAQLLYNTPSCRTEDIEKSPEVRLHMIEQIKSFMHPLRIHLDLEFKISILIRRGYVGRNPLSPLYAKQFAVGIKEILESELDEEGKNLIGNRSTAVCHTVVGISGIGKSTAVEKILLLYPQVIIHTNYKSDNRELGYLKQVVWLKLECPFNGSRKALCQNFFRIFDQLLETNYYQKFVKQRSSEEELIDSMTHISSLHCLGVLVIDEIQRMKPGEDGQNMIDFFVELSNKLGIPIIYIGTYKATPLFDRLLANARRAEGMGSDFLDPMLKDKEWDLFLNRLWEYQWTKKKVPLNQELSDTMFQLTMGITDFIIRLFTLSQQYAIAHGHEKLSVRIIKKVAKENMRFADRILSAIKVGDRNAIKKYDDIKPDWQTVNDYIQILGERLNLVGNIRSEHKRAINKQNSSINFEKLVEGALVLGVSSKEARLLASKVMDSSKGMQDLVQMQRALANYILNNSDIGGHNGQKVMIKDNNQKQIKPVMEDYDIRFNRLSEFLE